MICPSTWLRVVVSLPNHLVFVFCYLKFFITETRTLTPENSSHNSQHVTRAVGQVAPQALPDNLRVAPDKGFCQGTRFARTLTYLKANQKAS